MERILDCLGFGRDERTYNEDVRAFSLSLYFYSPRAYNYVRAKFNNHLPSVSAIKKWYACIDASPGFENDALETLKKKADEYKAKNKPLICALIKDEMAIRKHSQWNEHKCKFEGFVDLGKRLTTQGILPLAKDALVYLVSGLEEDFKIPVAYFFTDSLDTAQSAFVTNEVLTRLGEIGVEIASLTFDGLKTNFSMCRLLGADFENGAYIPDPFDENRKIYVFLDPPHMIKLARNCFATRNLIDSKGRVIQWRHIELLYEAQKNLSWNIGNKITKEHMQWEKRKMKVIFAAQTLSASVADSLEFCKQKTEAFADVDGTAEYARVLNDIFDTMNSNKSEGSVGFKRPMSMDTYREFFHRYDEAMEYIRGLKIEGECVSIFKSASHTPFTGFYNNMINFKRLFVEYVVTKKLDMLIAHRLCQDLLETFFGCIRSMNGYNDNPTVQQFEAAYRKLLIHNDIVCPKSSNCIEMGTKILTVSSHRPKKHNEAPAIPEYEIDDFIFDGDFENNFYSAYQYSDDVYTHSLAYKSSLLEKKILNAKKPKLLIKCEECINVFIENELMNDDFIRFKSKNSVIAQPCKSTFEICKFADTFLKFFNEKTISFEMAVLQILRKLPFESFYKSSDFKHNSEEHKYEFIKNIIRIYMNMKSVHCAKVTTLKVHDVPIRHDLKKMIHNAGQ